MFEGRAFDLSVGGVSVCAPRALPSGAAVILRFRDGPAEIVSLRASVLRMERTAGGRHRLLRCRFEGIRPGEEQALLHYVAARQRDLLREAAATRSSPPP